MSHQTAPGDSGTGISPRGDIDIHEACRRGRLSAVTQYLDHGGDIDKRTSLKETPLLLAAQFSHPELVSMLFKRGADIRPSDVKGQTALAFVCRGGYVDLYKELKDKIKDRHPGYIKESYTQLFSAACDGGCIEMIEFLLGQAESHQDVLVSLVALAESDACRDVIGSIVKLHGILHSACELGRLEVVEFLIGQGADPAGITEFGQTPLHAACGGGHPDVVRHLADHTAVGVLTKDFRGLTPMHMACLSGSLPCVVYLLERDASIDEPCDENVSGLDLLCNEGHLEVVRHLLENGRVADVNAALYAACEGGRLDIIKLLVAHGADIHFTHGFGETVAFAACQNEHIDVIAYLRQAGADLNARTADGVSLLCAAGEVGNLDMVKYLLSHGARIEAVSEEGKTAVHAAYDYEHLELANFLFIEWLIQAVSEKMAHRGINVSDYTFDLPLNAEFLAAFLDDDRGGESKLTFIPAEQPVQNDAEPGCDAGDDATANRRVALAIELFRPSQEDGGDVWSCVGSADLYVTPSANNPSGCQHCQDFHCKLSTTVLYFPNQLATMNDLGIALKEK